ncbi:MAG: hypothetical protein VX346_23405 [Planctomycetota bacterium]|nr:hypothetical protein [Planctomycetota bacterium]
MPLQRPPQLLLLVELLYSALYLALNLAPLTATGGETIDIGSRRELLLDEHLIEQLTGSARLRLHHPVPTDDVFVHDTPWEGNRTLYYSIFQDGARYRMYYRGSQIETTASGYSIPYNVTCYAESQDGIHWTRPDLGIVEFRGSKKNNIVLSGEICHAFVPFKDSNPACPDEHRYKAIVAIYKPQRGLHVYSSPDGIRWAPMHDAPVITTGYFDSQNLAFWDTVRQRYVGFHRALRGGPGQITPASKETSTKDVMTATSADFVNWSQPRWLEYSDERWIPFSSQPSPTSPYVQLYTNQIQPYHRAPHIYLGFPTRYVDSRATLNDLNRKLAASVKYFGAAYSDGGLMSSRDGQRFKFWDEAFIRPGNPARKRWVYGDNFQSWGLLETQSDIPAAPHELSLYVNEGFWRQCKLRRYRLRLDGFVSAFAPLRGGELVTRPITMSGTRLTLNLATSAAGSIRVEIQTPAGKPLDGYQAADCQVLFGDSLERVVEWNQGSDLSALSGVPLRLRILLKDADLYAFQFTP